MECAFYHRLFDFVWGRAASHLSGAARVCGPQVSVGPLMAVHLAGDAWILRTLTADSGIAFRLGRPIQNGGARACGFLALRRGQWNLAVGLRTGTSDC